MSAMSEVAAAWRVRTLSDVRNALDSLGRLGAIAATLAVQALVGCAQDVPEVAPSSAPPASPTRTASPTVAPSLSATPSAMPSASASPASTKDGTYATELSVSEDGALSYVPLRWYSGPNAAARCREKGIEPELAWCSDYYYEKAGERRAATLTEETKVRLLNDDLKPVDATLAQLVDTIESGDWPHFQIAVADGRVIRISQVFTP
jgi:hypothetical protein